eukprot:EG_transcript_12050
MPPAGRPTAPGPNRTAPAVLCLAVMCLALALRWPPARPWGRFVATGYSRQPATAFRTSSSGRGFDALLVAPDLQDVDVPVSTANMPFDRGYTEYASHLLYENLAAWMTVSVGITVASFYSCRCLPHARRWHTAAAHGVPVIQHRKVFCDLDGVLSDFNGRVLQIFGVPFEQVPPARLWGTLAKIGGGRPDGFYDQLAWMPEGRVLFEALRPYQPTILTGLPRGKWAVAQKERWCARELGPDVPVITCLAWDKHRYCTPGAVLIDDTVRLREAWTAAGGVFIHHTSVAETLQAFFEVVEASPKEQSNTA